MFLLDGCKGWASMSQHPSKLMQQLTTGWTTLCVSSSFSKETILGPTSQPLGPVELPRPVPSPTLDPRTSPPRSRTWVLVSAAAATAPHRKAAANSASSTRCNQRSAMAHKLPGSQPPKPRPRAQTRHFLGRVYSWRAGGLTVASTGNSPRAPSGEPGGRCGRSWAASARSGTLGWVHRAREKQSGRGARGSAARPDAQR